MKALVVYDSAFGNTEKIAQAMPPEGFYVAGTEGLLKEGELERAAAWAQQLQLKA